MTDPWADCWESGVPTPPPRRRTWMGLEEDDRIPDGTVLLLPDGRALVDPLVLLHAILNRRALVVHVE